MMCDRQVLSAYRDGELTPDQKWRVDEHLEDCAVCMATLRQYRDLAQRIRSLPVQPVPRTLGAEVRQRIAEREAERQRVHPLAGLIRAATPAVAAAAVAVAVMIMVRPGAGGLPRETSIAVAPPTESVATRAPDPAAGVPAQVAAQPEPPRSTVVPTPEILRVSEGHAGLSGPVERQASVGIPSIARLYQGSRDLGAQLGQPAEGSKTVTLIEQPFQGGLAIRRDDTHEIYVLHRAGGTWASYEDTWRLGDPVATDETPPPGALVPAGGFGQVWRDHAEVKSRLGWAVYEPRGSGGAIQAFERGIIIWSPHGLLYVLANDGTWKTYPDAAPL